MPQEVEHLPAQQTPSSNPCTVKRKKKSAMKDDVKASPFQDRESTEMFYLVDHRQK
jgi:hypothetical protein